MSAPRKPAVSVGQIPDNVAAPLRGLLGAFVARAHAEDGVGGRSAFRDRKLDVYDLVTLLLDLENRVRVLEGEDLISRQDFIDLVENRIR